MTEKRKRSPNWMVSEKNLLLDIVQKHLLVIENKKTDGVTIERKTAEWIIIRDKYNSQTTKYPEHTQRTAKTLRGQWESMKKAVKRKSSVQKNLTQTGACPLKMNVDDPIYNRVLSLIQPNVYGLQNSYHKESGTRVENQNTVSELTEEFEDLESQDMEHFKVLKVESLLSSSTLSPDSVQDSDSNNYTPLPEQQSVIKNLRGKERLNSMLKSNGPNETKKNYLSNSFTKTANRTHKIKMQIKEEELKIKREEVKQSKIRTRLLLLELKLKKRMLVKDQVH